MSSNTADTQFTDVLLRPAFVFGVLGVVIVAYAALIQQVPVLWFAVSLAVTAFVIWLLYRLVVAVEELTAIAGRIEASFSEE